MKKLLAMVLALVMTLSLAVSANAAFKDVKDIDETYAESAAVLNGLGVFKGYEEKDGTFSFQPKNAITRAEVAAIVYRIYTQDVKDAYVKNYETYNKFGDMAGAGWAKGYIGYCANAALVKGYPNGTFVPSGKVTGYEVLAMILRAVGYDQKNEFTGADWALHVAEIAERQGILDNVKGVDLNAPATREVVAELLFQSINVPMVTYTAAFGYQNVGLNEKADNKIFAKNETLGSKNFELDRITGYVTANDYGTKFKNMQIAGKNLAKKDDTVKVADQDIFDAGRYGHVWTSKGSVITDVFYDDALLSTSYAGTAIATLTTKKTGNSDYVADLAKKNMVVYNGNETVDPTIVKGTEVAMYSIDGKTISSIIVVNPTVDYMEADYVVKGDEVKIQGVKYDKDEVSGYEDLVKGDVFTFVDMADAVRYYEELAPINGQKTKYTIPTKGDAYITFADKDYEQSGLKDHEDNVPLFSKNRDTFDTDATIYLDRGGYVAYTLATADVAKYAMVIDSYSVLGEKHNTIEYYVNLLLTDGTETGYVLVDEDCVDAINDKVLFPDFTQVKASKNTYIGQPAATGNYIGLGTLVEYTVKDKVYTLSAFNECDREYLDDDYGRS
ncbi:MAG: S-layer homology domain-containing protein [Oscillospiraceae bacterium]